jgi:two-component system, chemotaxis family, protein-glutamate methylesterase/glutaminase
VIPVLVVDDSPTARAMVRAILRLDPDMEVVGEASDGQEAVDLVKRLRPRVITMDMQMPRMDGLQAIQEIMIESPTPIVVVTGSMRAGDVEASLQALRAGAVSILRKPPGPASPAHGVEAQRLVETVRAMADVKVVGRARRTPPQPPAAPAPQPGVRAGVVAVAASTGGPAALHRLLSELPPNFGVPMLVVQHMSPGFVPGLAKWLAAASDLEVRVATQGDRLQANTVYLAPDDHHLGVTTPAIIELSTAPPIGGFRPSATFLFESVARAFGRAALAVVLTGMGDDGLTGLRSVRSAGGRIVAQGEESSVIFGMPGAAVAAGLADRTVELGELASHLTTLTNGNGGTT